MDRKAREVAKRASSVLLKIYFLEFFFVFYKISDKKIGLKGGVTACIQSLLSPVVI